MKKKLSSIEIIIIITIVLVILWNVFPLILIRIYGSRPYYEVPTWVVYFLTRR